jgi:hypothetical protein
MHRVPYVQKPTLSAPLSLSKPLIVLPVFLNAFILTYADLFPTLMGVIVISFYLFVVTLDTFPSIS